MNNKFSLFDNYPFLHPLDKEEAVEVQKLLKWLSQCKTCIPSFSLPQKITDHMILCFLKAVNEGHMQINPKAWNRLLETLFTQGLMNQIVSPSLRNYLLIQLAKNTPLSR
jgi:hypothetical protein